MRREEREEKKKGEGAGRVSLCLTPNNCTHRIGKGGHVYAHSTVFLACSSRDKRRGGEKKGGGEKKRKVLRIAVGSSPSLPNFRYFATASANGKGGGEEKKEKKQVVHRPIPSNGKGGKKEKGLSVLPFILAYV